MAITSRDIRRGCKSRTKAVFKRRNGLLAAELDDFLNGRIGIIAFLEHCSSILLIKTKRREDEFLARRSAEQQTDRDKTWAEQHRRELLDAAVSLHSKLTGEERVLATDVLATVRSWAFQPLDQIDDLHFDEEEFSLVQNEPARALSRLRVVRALSKTCIWRRAKSVLA